MASRANSPITVALVDDYDVVVMGVAKMFDQYRDRVVVAELDSNEAVKDVVDIALYDSFAQPESDHEEIAVLVANPTHHRHRRQRDVLRLGRSAMPAPGGWSLSSRAAPGGTLFRHALDRCYTARKR